MLHTRSAALAALVLLSVTAVVSAAQHGSFADYLASKSSSSVVPSGEGGYQPTEVLETCLKETGYRNCIETTYGYYSNRDFTCCGKDYSNQLLKETTTVGTCFIQEVIFWEGDEINVDTNIWQLGTFHAICTLNDKSSQCGHPFCDKMVLNVDGTIYRVDQAVLSSTPPFPNRDDSCGGFRKKVEELPAAVKELMALKTKKMSQSRRHTQANTPAKAAYDGGEPGPYEPRGGAPTLYRSPYAVVYYGPMTVNSREHSTKYTQGWFEYVADYGTPTESITPAEAAGDYVLDPFTFKLTFIKDKAY